VPRAVIVQAATTEAAARSVEAVGGIVDVSLPIIAGVAARVTAGGIAILGANPSLHVTADAAMRPTSDSFDASALDTQVAAINPGATWSPDAGRGVGVALVDTGVVDTNAALNDPFSTCRSSG